MPEAGIHGRVDQTGERFADWRLGRYLSGRGVEFAGEAITEKRTVLRDCYFLTIPSFFMRASRVVGFSPSASAAPPGPRTRQAVRSSMRKI